MNIIVTGAGKGIGLELCRKFLEKEDFRVIGLSRDLTKLDLLAGINKNLIPITFDLGNGNYSVLADQLGNLTGRHVNILVNNAGLLINKAFRDLTPEENMRMWQVNYLGPYKLIQALLPYFSSDAHIVNVSSMSGFQGSSKFIGLSGYSASKAALASLTECLAGELKEYGIKVNCLCPGSVQTEMFEAAFPGSNASVSPVQMAAFIADFALQAHHCMNGKVIPVSFSPP